MAFKEIELVNMATDEVTKIFNIILFNIYISVFNIKILLFCRIVILILQFYEFLN
tara:strand:- start:1619 stop:1783 length:165 start_codon:yes stop_codon:yes gene_type:complete